MNSVQGLGSVRPRPGQASLHPKHVRRVIELAFLGVTASWEEFLERTLVRYMAGAKCDGGYGPSLRVGPCIGLRHAYQLLSGDPFYEPARRFLVWTDRKGVVDVARVFFERGEPYVGAMNQFSRELDLAGDIRNRIAHVSPKAKRKFRAAALHFLNVQTLTRGYAAGDLLRAVPLRGFASLPTQQTGTQRIAFSAYMDMYGILANKIAPPPRLSRPSDASPDGGDR